MRKQLWISGNILLTSLACEVNAAHINLDGVGQVALLPYYNVNNSFITNINVTNTTNLYKAVKLRFHESHISADVFNFNIYLSPYDIWNGTISLNTETNVPKIISEDETCTIPSNALFKTGIDFRNTYTTTTNEDLSEGYVEIIEMGVIADGTGPASDNDAEAEIDASGSADGLINLASGDRSIPAGITHGANGVPTDCSVVSNAWSAGFANNTNINGFEPGALGTEGIAVDAGGFAAPYADSNNAGLVEPTGGINAVAYVINTGTGMAFLEQGIHIDNYSTVAQHYPVSNSPFCSSYYLLPSLASGDVTTASMLDTTGSGVKSATMTLTEYDTGAVNNIAPNPSIPMGSNPFPIATILSSDAVTIQYFIESAISANTDFVLTFPMRLHGIYNGATLVNQLNTNFPACSGTLNDATDDGATVPLPIFNTTANDYPNDGNSHICNNAGFVTNQLPDTRISLTYYDYNEQSSQVIPDCYEFTPPFPPSQCNPIALDRGVNVITVNRSLGGSTSVLGTPAGNIFTWTLSTPFEAGWVTINMDQSYDYNTDASIAALTQQTGGINLDAANVWTGVPVIGFSVSSMAVGPSQSGEAVEFIRKPRR